MNYHIYELELQIKLEHPDWTQIEILTKRDEMLATEENRMRIIYQLQHRNDRDIRDILREAGAIR